MAEHGYELVHRISKYWGLHRKSREATRAIADWRKEHDGILPKKVWLNTLEIGGTYSCVEIIPYESESGVLFLKKRHDARASTQGERKWEGKLHIPGISELASIKGEDVLPKLLKGEVLRDPEESQKIAQDLKFLTQGRYPEPERKTIADTLVLLLPVHADMLQSDFFPVTQDNIDEVIEQHRPIIKKYWEGNMPLILDTRKR